MRKFPRLRYTLPATTVLILVNEGLGFPLFLTLIVVGMEGVVVLRFGEKVYGQLKKVWQKLTRQRIRA